MASSKLFAEASGTHRSRIRRPMRVPLYLCNDNYQSLSSRTAAPLSGLFASDIRLINFHHTRNAVSPRTYHCAAEFVQPSPGSIVTTQAENLLQAQRTGASF